MPTFPNLISTTTLVTETVELLRATGGAADAVEVAAQVFKMPALDQNFAALLVGDVVAQDPRLRMRDAATVELIATDFERRALSKSDFVVFDLETTGAKPPASRVTEIGAYKVSGGRIVGEFQTLVNPETEIPPFIAQLTGISNQMVANAPLFSEVAADFLDFVGDSVLVAHNAGFDLGFLNYELNRTFPDSAVINPNLCTVRLSRKLLPKLKNHRLHTVAEHYSIIIENRHRAGDDALATAKIFVHFLDLLHQRGVHDLQTARHFKAK